MDRSSDPRELAALTCKVWQAGRWVAVTEIMPASVASRIGCTLLREIGQRPRFTPLDLDVTGEVRRFTYTAHDFVLRIRRISKGSKHE